MKKGTGASLGEIAKDCGLSKSTVSNILSGSRGHLYAESTRQKVLEAHRRLGYVPDHRGLSLRTHQTHLIGLYAGFAVERGTPSVMAVIGGALSECRNSPYELILFGEHREGVAAFVEALKGNRFDGAMVVVDFHLPESWVREIDRLKLPWLVIEKTTDVSAGVVEVDEAKGMDEALAYLAQLGHRSFAYFHPEGLLLRRRRAFEDACRRHGTESVIVPIDQAPGFKPGFSPEECARRALQLVQKRERPTALIVGCGDAAAMTVIRALNGAGCRVPEAVSVVGWDDIPVAENMGLSTVSKPLAEMGRAGAREMLRMLGDSDYRPGRIHLETRLVVRDTTGPVKG